MQTNASASIGHIVQIARAGFLLCSCAPGLKWGMRVVHVYKDYPPVVGGIENHLKLLAEGQAQRGLDVTVLVTAPDRHTTESREGGVRVIRAAQLVRLRSTPLSPALAWWLRRLEAGVVHLHFPYPFGEVAQLFGRRSPGQALVVTYHSDIVRQRLLGWLYRPMMRRVLERTDRILASSEAYVRSSAVLARYAAKTAVVPLGVEVDRFASLDAGRVEEIRRRFPGPRVLFVGQLRYYKGVDVLIRAVEKLHGEGIQATLLIAGSGPMAARWRRQVAASSVEDVHFLGDVADDELPSLYAAADIFVLPSCRRSEAYGLALAEAMASGTAVISTELGTGTSWVNRDGETGLVVPPQDPAALASALERWLGDPGMREAMAERARQRARQELGVEQMIDRVVQVYEAVRAAKSSHPDLDLRSDAAGR